MVTYTRDDFKELRDILMKDASSFISVRHGPTAKHLLDCLFMDPDPRKLERDLGSSSRAVGHTPVGENDIDYVTAYDLLFGDVSHTALHINDALLPVARWRLHRSR